MNAYIDTLIVSDENGAEKILYPKTKQEAVFGLIERLGKLEAPHITETEATTMENSYAGRLEVVEIGGGESEQVTTTGAQLFDGLLEQGSFDGVLNKIDSEYRVRNSVNRPVTPNKTYTISSRVAKEASIFELDSEGNFLRILSSFASLPLTFTTSSNGHYIALVLRISDTTAITPNMVNDVMLNEGTEALPWEPYTGGLPAPSPDYPQEIKKTVVSEIKTHGKNLINAKLNQQISGNDRYYIYDVNPGESLTMYLKQKTTVFDSAYPSAQHYHWFANKEGVFIKSGTICKLTFDSVNQEKEGISIMTVPDEAVCLIVDLGTYFSNSGTRIMTLECQIEKGENFTGYEPYTESVITLSQPIELYRIGDVHDVIEGNKVKRRFKAITLTENDGWKLNSSGNAYYCTTLDGAIKTNSTIISTHFRKGYWMTMEEGTICLGNSVLGVLGISSLSFSSVDDLKSFLANNEVIAVYALEKETNEELPIADQIALNNLQTFDGVTYLEFDSEIEPTYKGKYGTSEVGGMVLEALLAGRNGELYGKRIEALEATVVNNI